MESTNKKVVATKPTKRVTTRSKVVKSKVTKGSKSATKTTSVSSKKKVNTVGLKKFKDLIYRLGLYTLSIDLLKSDEILNLESLSSDIVSEALALLESNPDLLNQVKK